MLDLHGMVVYLIPYSGMIYRARKGIRTPDLFITSEIRRVSSLP